MSGFADNPPRRRPPQPGAAPPLGSGLDCAAVADLAEGYALDALDPDEAELVRRHLAACPSCAGTVDGLARTLAHLALLAPRAVPPVDVKVQLFARIAQTREATTAPNPSQGPVAPDPRSDLARTWAHGELPPPTPTLPASRTRLDRFRDRLIPAVVGPGAEAHRGWRANVGPLVTATVPLVLALALVGYWAMDLRGDMRAVEGDRDDLEARIITLGELAAGSRSYPIEGDGERAEASFLVNPATSRGMVSVLRMENPDPDAEYLILCQTKLDQFQRVGVLRVDEEGNGMAQVTLSAPFEQYEALYILPEGVTPGEATLAGALRAQIAPTPTATPSHTPAPTDAPTGGTFELGSPRPIMYSSPTSAP